jgi:cytochrome P450
MTEQQVAWDVGILADAGVETMSATLMIFVLACIAHPEWLPRAQKELDKVVGSERLPDFGDLKDLPYVQAVVEEVFRWRHPQQAGIPHATTHEDYYQGYLIPKGSVVIPLFCAMRHDEDLFDKPAEFRPERWIGKSQINNFGYGRRTCPGRRIARNSASIVIARLLWAFNIRTSSGKKLVVEESMFTTGFVSAPKPFACIFEPRSETHVRVVQESFKNVEKNVATLLSEVLEKHNALGIKARAWCIPTAGLRATDNGSATPKQRATLKHSTTS